MLNSWNVGFNYCIFLFISFDISNFLILRAQRLVSAADTACLVDVAYTDGEHDVRSKDHLSDNEELQHINLELEKEYVFALKKVNIYCRELLLCVDTEHEV